MRIGHIIRTFIEKFSKKSCDKCSHCVNSIWCDNYVRYSKCASGIYPNGFESK